MENLELETLKIKYAKAIAALKFYADSYQYGEGNGLSWEHCEHKKIGADRGRLARECLRELGEE